MNSPTISIIAAVAQNGIIGREGDMPWRLSSDLKRFKALTTGKPVIMGRKTFQSIGKPLPNRLNIVVSRQGFSADGVVSVAGFEDGIEVARQWCIDNGADEIAIIGGGEIYRLALQGTGDNQVSRLYVTHVMAEPDGDTRFPEISEAEWRIVEREKIPAGEKDSAETLFVIYERK